MHTIQIPKPCHESWNSMSPVDQGRHCALCCKTVVDFTRWELPDILSYLQQHNHTCGRFKSNQLNQPIPEPEVFISAVRYSPLSFSARIAAIIVFVFAIAAASCNNKGGQQQAMTTTQSLPGGMSQMVIGDTIAVPPVVDTSRPPKPVTCGQGSVVVPGPPDIVTGEPAVVPEPPDPETTTMGAPAMVQPEKEALLPKDSL